ncbi:MAG: hypothetical protein H0U98_10280 [Alphaproteobacteria bacterium]|nr:hypothetical protein [Alphaproteobacteria bacterium]
MTNPKRNSAAPLILRKSGHELLADGRNAMIVIAGFNALSTVQDWTEQSKLNCPRGYTQNFSWRKANEASEVIRARPVGTNVTLVGHSLGGGHAQLIAQELPAGSIHTLITVASFVPNTVNSHTVQGKVGHWLNILSAPFWSDRLLDFAGTLIGWHNQGIVCGASNYRSEFPHHDFYRMMQSVAILPKFKPVLDL